MCVNNYNYITNGGNIIRFKKLFLIICLLICLFGVAGVMASDVNDTIAVNNNQNDDLIEIENDEISVERNNEFIGVNDFENDSFENNLDILRSSESQDEISLDDNSDVLSAKSPSSDDYSVHVTSTVSNIGDSSGTITVYIDTPCNLAGYYKYHFKLNIWGSNGNGYSKEYYSTSSTSPVKYTFDPIKFGVGTHDIVIQNCLNQIFILHLK